MTTNGSALVLATQIERKYGTLGSTQLLKLVYYSEAWAQVLGGTLFTDPIEAWGNGPVVRSVWNTAKYSSFPSEAQDMTPARQALLDAVVPFYARKSGGDLSQQTHQEAPWKDAYAKGMNTEIDRGEIRRFYARQAIIAPSEVPQLPNIRMFRPSISDVVHQAKEISGKWERTLTILGS